MECVGSTYCTDLTQVGENLWEYWHPGPQTGGGVAYGGCIVCNNKTVNGSYSNEAITLLNRFVQGGVTLGFPGSWSEDLISGNGSVQKKRDGYGNSCQGVCTPEILESDSGASVTFTYSETSYGMDGSKATYLGDGRFAVLVSKLSLGASGYSFKGSGSTSLEATTTVILKLADDGEEYEFELAEDEYSGSLGSCATDRRDLGIKPHCWANDRLPASFSVRGFHWYEDEMFLVAFVFRNVFYAYLFEKSEAGVWQATQLTDFEQWVSDNDLDGYLMFLK